jgi:hypothetical protein
VHPDGAAALDAPHRHQRAATERQRTPHPESGLGRAQHREGRLMLQPARSRRRVPLEPAQRRETSATRPAIPFCHRPECRQLSVHETAAASVAPTPRHPTWGFQQGRRSSKRSEAPERLERWAHPLNRGGDPQLDEGGELFVAKALVGKRLEVSPVLPRTTHRRTA